jgi:hypothetical protein
MLQAVRSRQKGLQALRADRRGCRLYEQAAPSRCYCMDMRIRQVTDKRIKMLKAVP